MRLIGKDKDCYPLWRVIRARLRSSRGTETISVSFNARHNSLPWETTPAFLRNYSLPDSVKNQFCRTVQVQFLKDIAAVCFGSIDADVQ